MISAASALSLAATFPPERLRSSVPLAILDGRVLQPDGRGDSQPEDLAVAILLGPPGTARDATLAGCRDVFSTLLADLAQSHPVPTTPVTGHELPINEAVAHFGALLNRSAAPELAPYTKSLLQLVLRQEVDREVRGPIVRAALAYASSESEAPFWEPLVADELIPVWAFKALVQIDPRHSRIVRTLGSLWVRTITGNLRLNVAMLTRELSKQQIVPFEFLTQLQTYVENVLRSPEHLATFHSEWSKVIEFNKASISRKHRLPDTGGYSVRALRWQHATAPLVFKASGQQKGIGKTAQIISRYLAKLHDPTLPPVEILEQNRPVKIDQLIALARTKRVVLLGREAFSESNIHRIVGAMKPVTDFKSFVLHTRTSAQRLDRVSAETIAPRACNWLDEKLGNPGDDWWMGIHTSTSAPQVKKISDWGFAEGMGDLRSSISVRKKPYHRRAWKTVEEALRFSLEGQ